jgi:hypothetical protein
VRPATSHSYDGGMAAKTKDKTPKTPRTVHPVTITHRPVTRCALLACQQPVSYDPVPGGASAALTEHYNTRHPDGVLV